VERPIGRNEDIHDREQINYHLGGKVHFKEPQTNKYINTRFVWEPEKEGKYESESRSEVADG